ncbi:MAG: hypothetical protein ACREQ5_13860, partial [Candidatus Dormibacteria bacterium]
PQHCAVLGVASITTPTGAAVHRDWRCGCTVTWRHDTKGRNAPEWVTHSDPVSVWRTLTEATRSRGVLQVYAHRLGRALILSDAFNVMAQLGWVVKRANVEDNFSSVSFTDGKRGMRLIDVSTYFGDSLPVIERHMKRERGPLGGDGGSVSGPQERLRFDVDTVRLAVVSLHDYFKDHDLGNFGASGAACGWALWRHRHYTHKVICHDDTAALEAEATSAYMGRNEAWRRGVRMAGPFFQWDMSSAYPRVAAQVDLPWKLATQCKRILEGRTKGLHDRYRVLYRARVETDVPVVPWRDATGICWPVGTFTSLLWDVEVDAAMAAGAVITPQYHWLYNKAPVLRSWAQWSLDRIALGTDGAPWAVPLWIKAQSRGVIGKFACAYPELKAVAYTGDLVPQVNGLLELETGERGRSCVLSGTVFEALGRQLSRDAFPAMNSAIVAECRVRMWKALQAIPPGDVVQMHTDGIWVNRDGHGAMWDHAEANPEHGWREKRKSKWLTVHGPNSVEWDDGRAMAGVPNRATRTGGESFRGEQWEGAATALARSGGGGFRDLKREWIAPRLDTRRNSDGSPIRVTEDVREPSR